MTIENYIKEKLKADLSAMFVPADPYAPPVFVFSNDISYKAMSGQIVCEIKTGQTKLSDLQGIAEGTIPVTVYFKCISNEVQNVLDMLNQYIQSVNGEEFTTSDDGYLLSFTCSTPTLFAKQLEEVNGESEYVSYGMFMLETYFCDAKSEETIKKLDLVDIIGGAEAITETIATNILNWTESIEYSYQTLQGQSSLGDVAYDGMTRIFNITLAIAKGDTTSTAYYLNKYRATYGGKYLYLTSGSGTNIDINNLKCYIRTITKIEYQGIPTLQIVLVARA